MRPNLFSDDPIDGATDRPDLLDRTLFAGHVADVLGRVRDQSESSVVSLVGAWGSGKSSLLNMATDALEADPGWVVNYFNPWTYSDIESLISAFFTELRSSLPKGDQWSERRKKIGRFGEAVSPLGKISMLVGLDTSTMLQKLSEIVGGDDSTAELRETAAEALNDLGYSILIVLDDLDRLSSNELLLVFKLVRLVGRLPNVYYLLSYDEKTLLDILQATDLVGPDESRARDYVEKMVQVRLDLPAFRPTQAGAMFERAVLSVLDNNALTLPDDERARLFEMYQEHLTERLLSPRAVNRLLAQVDALYPLIRNEVNFVDYLLLAFIRTSEPRLFTQLPRWRAALTGSTGDMWYGTGGPSNADTLKAWKDKITSSGVSSSDLDGITNVLAEPFLPIRKALKDMQYSGYDLSSLGRRQRVGHVDYFDRYFAFTVPEEDFADSDLNQALEDLAATNHTEAVEKLRSELTRNTERTVRKLLALDDVDVQLAEQLLQFTVSAYEGVHDVSSSNSLVSPRVRFATLTRHLVGRLDAADGPTVLQRSLDLRTPHGVHLLAGTLSKMVDDATADSSVRSTYRLTWHATAGSILGPAVKEKLQAADADDVYHLDEETFSLFYYWRNLDELGAFEWIRAQVNGGRWALLDLLARFVPVILSDTPEDASLGEFDLAFVDSIFGLDYVLERLSDEIGATEPQGLPRSLELRLDDRRDYVLSVLRRASDQRHDAARDSPGET